MRGTEIKIISQHATDNYTLVPAKAGFNTALISFLFGCSIFFFLSPLFWRGAGGEVFSQNTFQRTYGGTGNDQANDVLEVAGGGYIIAGSTESFGSGLSDMYLVRTDTNGTVLWSKTFGGTNDEYGNAVKQTLDGGFIIAGSTGTFPASSSGVDLYLVKTDANGNLQWSKTVDMASSNNRAIAVLQTADSGFVAGGISSGEYYLVKTDVNGNLLWTHTYGLGPDNDDFEDMAQTTDGGFILVGTTFNIFTNASFGAYLIKTDGAGNVQWSKAYAVSPPGNPTWGTNECRAVTIAQDGNILVSTESDNVISNSGVDIIVFKIDNNGNMLWTSNAYGWPDPSFETAWDIIPTPDGGSAEGGQAIGTIFGVGGEMLLLKRDSMGALQWAKTYGGTGHEVAQSVKQTSDGGYILAGYANSFGAGNRDIYLIKTDANGNSSGCNQQEVFPPAGPPLITNDTGTVSSTGGIASVPVTIETTPPTLDSLFCQPVANFYESDTSICAGNCINFYDITANNPTSWNWSFAGATPSSSTVQHPANICYNIPGTYTVQLIAQNAISSDTAQITVIVNGNNLTVNTGTTADSCGNCNGTATAIPSGGNGNYLYYWSNGQIDSTATGLCAGNYSVTVSESDSVDNVFWNEDFSNGGTGWVLNQNGTGVNGFWPNFWVINSLSGCSCGTGNNLHITCGNTIINCVFNPGICIYNPGTSFDPVTDKIAVSPNIATLGKTNIKLKFQWIADGEAGDDFGKLRLSNDGGSTWTELATSYSGATLCGQDSIVLPAIYENIPDFKIAFRWINSGNGNGNDPPFGIDDIELSTVSVGGSCSFISNVTLNSSSGITASVMTVDAACGSNNGSATTTPSGGTSPYSYLWSTTPVQTDSTATNLPAGNYFVTITDDNGCNLTISATVNNTGGIIPVITAGSPTTFCQGDSVQLTASTATTYLWSNGDTTQSITVMTSGNYSVTVADSTGCTGDTTVTVTVISEFLTNASVAICQGDSIFLSGSWQMAGGSYYDTLIAQGGCDSIIATALTVNSGFLINASASICQGDSIFLSGSWQTAGGAYYDTLIAQGGCDSVIASALTVNSGFLTNSSAAICQGDSIFLSGSWQTAGGAYYDTLTSSGGCDSIIAIALTVETLPTVFAGNDTVITAGATIQLNGSGGVIFQWSPSTLLSCTSCPNPIASPEESITYFVTVTDASGCKNSDSISITVEPLECFIDDKIVPNIFSPNGDGQNDLLTIHGKNIEVEIFRIYDRWGEEIFSAKGGPASGGKTMIGWDGTKNGKRLNSGVFVYYLKAGCPGKEPELIKGNFTLVR